MRKYKNITEKIDKKKEDYLESKRLIEEIYNYKIILVQNKIYKELIKKESDKILLNNLTKEKKKWKDAKDECIDILKKAYYLKN